MCNVTIPAGHSFGISIPETTVVVLEHGAVIWQGKKIGRVWKGTRTYSPPTHKGSRVAKYHQQVPCWYAAAPGQARDSLPMDTRRTAIRWLIAEATRED